MTDTKRAKGSEEFRRVTSVDHAFNYLDGFFGCLLYPICASDWVNWVIIRRRNLYHPLNQQSILDSKSSAFLSEITYPLTHFILNTSSCYYSWHGFRRRLYVRKVNGYCRGLVCVAVENNAPPKTCRRRRRLQTERQEV